MNSEIYLKYLDDNLLNEMFFGFKFTKKQKEQILIMKNIIDKMFWNLKYIKNKPLEVDTDLMDDIILKTSYFTFRYHALRNLYILYVDKISKEDKHILFYNLQSFKIISNDLFNGRNSIEFKK